MPVWLVVGVGRLLPTRMWDALAVRSSTPGDPWDLDEEVVPLTLVDRMCTSAGPRAASRVRHRIDCPIAPELFDPGHAPGTYRQ